MSNGKTPLNTVWKFGGGGGGGGFVNELKLWGWGVGSILSGICLRLNVGAIVSHMSR